MALATNLDQRSPHRLVVALGGVDLGEPADQHFQPGCDHAGGLTSTEDRVLSAAFGDAADDVAGADQLHDDLGGDAAQRFAPADDVGDGFLVHAVLQRDDTAGGCQIILHQHGRPGGVVGLDADEGDVDGFFALQTLEFGQVVGLDRHGEAFLRRRAFQGDAVGAHLLHMLWPGVKERDVQALLGEIAANVSADSAGADDENAGVGHVGHGERFLVF